MSTAGPIFYHWLLVELRDWGTFVLEELDVCWPKYWLDCVFGIALV